MLVIGLLAGALGKDGGGIIMTMLLGIAGSFIGGIVGGALPIIPDGNGGLIGRIISATIGALILLFVYRKIKQSKQKKIESSDTE